MAARLAFASSNRLRTWAPLAALTAGAALPAVRPFVLVGLALGAGAAVARGRARTPDGWRWLATLPAAVGLGWAGLALTPMPLPDAAHCTDPLALPAVSRVAQAILVLGTAVLAARIAGDRDALRIRRPSNDRALAVALLAPFVLVPAALWVGPFLAQPFFGHVGLATGDLRALVPACLFAVANAGLEEVEFRGSLLGWSAPALGMGGAILGQAAVFGFAHLGTDITGLAPLLWLGMAASGAVAGLVAVRSGSLLLPFTVHAALDVPLFYAYACRAAV
jgi:membrane protease YdiL (CAAX protease family)